jgi:peptide/nickel transport system substrate-binding protein
MQWIIGVRNDVSFTDGEPLTARDVAFTLDTIMNAEAAQADLSMIRKVTAVDDETVVLDMVKPFNSLLYTLAVVGIVPAHYYDKNYGAAPIGSGRYMLEQWDKGQQIILVANPNYYGDAPLIQRIVVVFLSEDAALAAVQAGQVDIAFTSALLSDQVVNGYELLTCKTVDSRGISLPVIAPGVTRDDGPNTYPAGNEVTSDIAVRRAINYAVDRDRLIKNVLNGYGTPAYSVADMMPWASSDMEVTTDVAKAEKLLDEAGWLVGADGIREKGEIRAAFELIYASNDPVRQALSADFADQMKQIGIEVSIKGASWDDIYPQEFSTPVLWGWGSNSPIEIYELNYSTGWGNYSCYENKTSDALFDQALATTTIEESYEFYKEAQWNGTEGVAPQGSATWVWLANVDHLYFKRDNLSVADQKPHPHGHGWSLVNNIDRWSWKA